jgi:hypothetical protein
MVESMARKAYFAASPLFGGFYVKRMHNRRLQGLDQHGDN